MSRRSLGPGPLLRLALAGGRTDYLRITLTAIGSAVGTLILFGALSVLMIDADNGPYQLDVLDQPGLHPGVIITLVLVSIPVLIFVGLSTRVGAPARDRRLAMIRMAGATPAQTTRIAASETGIAAFLGSSLGALGFYAIRVFYSTARPVETTIEKDGVFIENGEEIHGIEYSSAIRDGYLLPTDVDIGPWFVIALTALIPALAATSAILALRKVNVSPFGVTRRQPTRPPAVVPAILFLSGTIGLATWDRVRPFLIGQGAENRLSWGVGLVFLLTSVAGLILGTASLTLLMGRAIGPRTGRTWLLLASRRMMAAPFTSSRAATAVVAAAFIGGVIGHVRSFYLTSSGGSDDQLEANVQQDQFYIDTFNMLNWALLFAVVLASASLLVTSAEAIVERRRTFAALSAAGTPRRTLALSALAETLLPLAPAVALSSISGTFAARGIFGTTTARETTYNEAGDLVSESGGVEVPIAWDYLATLSLSTFAVCTVVTALSLAFLARSTSPTELRTAV